MLNYFFCVRAVEYKPASLRRTLVLQVLLFSSKYWSRGFKATGRKTPFVCLCLPARQAGAPVIACWIVLKHLSFGYREINAFIQFVKRFVYTLVEWYGGLLTRNIQQINFNLVKFYGKPDPPSKINWAGMI